MLEQAQVFNASRRWMAAMMAAIALHAVLLLSLPTSTIEKTHPPQRLEVYLFTPPISTATQPSIIQKKPLTLPPPLVKKRRHRQAVKKHLVDKPITIVHPKKLIPTPIKHQSILPPAAQTIAMTTSQAHPTSQPTPSDSIKKNIQTVSDAVRMKILAEVRYPKRARRHGWSGIVECAFDIQQHQLQNITVVHSSNYPILDRAAIQSLKRLTTIELPNGHYEIPVVFHLTPY